MQDDYSQEVRRGIGDLGRDIRPSRIPILMYHSVSHNPNPKFAQFAVSPDELAEHVSYLAESRYVPLTVSDLVARLTTRAPLPERTVVLTFDDGFADFYEAALPILRQWRFTATLYLVTGYIGGAARWLWREGAADQRILTWEQISEIAGQGVECGAHSHTHSPLDLLAAAQQRDEAQRSKALLEARLGMPVTSFAYPYGYHTKRTRQIVREAGFLSSCAVGYRLASPHDNPFALARLKIARGTSVAMLTRQLEGRRLPIAPTLSAGRTHAWRLARFVAGRVPRVSVGSTKKG